MAHRITLTGFPKTNLRIYKNFQGKKIYMFEIEDKGKENVPKGLMRSHAIIYTVFINETQLTRNKIDKNAFMENEYLIIGEPTLRGVDLKYKGQLGVICERIELKPKRVKQEIKYTLEDVKTLDLLIESMPEHQALVNIEDLKPAQTPAPTKAVSKAIEYIIENKCFEKAITVHKTENKVLENYQYYLIAKEKGLTTIPVNYK